MIETFTLNIEPLGQSPRTVYVYLPKSYTKTTKSYPVLYMFDGHNLFLDEWATYGKSWGFSSYLDRHNLDLVVIGVDCNHEGTKRLDEYCPYPVPKSSWIQPNECLGKQTADWFVQVLKPYCETKYRLHTSRDHVGIGGSSMGGLMSLYCVLAYNSVFGKAACLSSAFRMNQTPLLKCIQETSLAQSTYIYMDYGSQEFSFKSQFQCLSKLNQKLLQKGVSTYPRIVRGGTHNEATWEASLPVFLPYLFPELYI